MSIVEFRATVKNGVIKVPSKYLRNLTKRVRVILLAEPAKSNAKLIDQLLEHPLHVRGFRPMIRKEIYAR